MDHQPQLEHSVQKNGQEMNLSELRSFVSVARTGSYSTASIETGIAKSTLSKRVQVLEKSLGLRLIERNSRGLRLTEEGEILMDRAVRLLADADELENMMRDRHAEPIGRLRVSAPVMFGQEFMGQIAAQYSARWPSSSIEVQLTDRRVDLLDEDFDCAIRVGDLPDSDMIVRRLFSSRTILVASPQCAKKLSAVHSPEDLKGQPTICFAPAVRATDWLLDRSSDRTILKPEGTIKMSSLHGVRDAALAGGGIAFLPELMVQSSIDTGALVHLLPDWHGPATPISIVYPPHRYASARVKALVELLLNLPLGKISPSQS